MTDETRRCTSLGRQVLLDGGHFATARDHIAAKGIADALEYVGLSFDQIPPPANKAILEALA